MGATQRGSSRLNWKVAITLLALVLLAVPALLLLKSFQAGQIRRTALEQVRSLTAKGENSLALRHLGQYLRTGAGAQ